MLYLIGGISSPVQANRELLNERKKVVSLGQRRKERSGREEEALYWTGY